jgi:hypothetical protein
MGLAPPAGSKLRGFWGMGQNLWSGERDQEMLLPPDLS